MEPPALSNVSLGDESIESVMIYDGPGTSNVELALIPIVVMRVALRFKRAIVRNWMKRLYKPCKSSACSQGPRRKERLQAAGLWK